MTPFVEVAIVVQLGAILVVTSHMFQSSTILSQPRPLYRSRCELRALVNDILPLLLYVASRLPSPQEICVKSVERQFTSQMPAIKGFLAQYF